MAPMLLVISWPRLQGAEGRTWRAYLSTSTTNARDRIGTGPWHNADGELIAEDINVLHSEDNNISKQTALREQGEEIAGRGDDPNRHDILTGSNPDGTAITDMTCDNWTSNGEGQAMVGHHDRMGLRDDAPSRSWNSSHPSRGCSQEDLRSTGGDGLFYCFACLRSCPALTWRRSWRHFLKSSDHPLICLRGDAERGRTGGSFLQSRSELRDQTPLGVERLCHVLWQLLGQVVGRHGKLPP
jgi:hypothetical protein